MPELFEWSHWSARSGVGPASLPVDAVGTRIADRYRVEELLGTGGMGAVYRVLDEATGRRLALKRLIVAAGSHAHSELTLLFRREFHTLATLRHPRIVRAYEYAVDAAGPFYTLELLEGRDLVDCAPLPYEKACTLLRDVASALAFLHARKLLHRDVAPRNVRTTADGQAKLIDFGVLATAGVAGDIVGTPPCVAPEVLQHAPLDHRADLYGLGALGYWMLTGVHAYPVHRFEQLPEAWHRSPPPPSAVQPGIPEALDDLVLSLLSHDPLARPAEAAEVIERLGALAGAPALTELETARGYLASASLVGREEEMRALREAVEQARAGAGRAILLEGPSGVGKTRLLREASLEAQLGGLTVLRADSDAAMRGPWGVLRALLTDLLRVVPRPALDAALPHAPVLVRALPELSRHLGHIAPAPLAGDPREERAAVQSKLLSWLRRVAETVPLALVIEDIQRADEASDSLLAALAHEADAHRMLLVAALRTDEAWRAPVSLAALQSVSRRLRLRGLDPEGVETLVRSLFGDAPHLARFAAWMHDVAGGSPLRCIELSRHLVEREVVRYVDGLWVLPEELSTQEVPKSLAEAMDARVASLSEPARALGRVLAVHGNAIDLPLAMRVAGAADERTVFEALDELMAEEVLVGTARSYRFRHDGLREAFLRSLDDVERRQLHRRTGQALLASGTVGPDREAEVGWHLTRGGDEERGSAWLERAGRRLYEAQSFQDAVEPLETALRIYERLGKSPRTCVELRFMLVCAGFLCDRDLTLRYADETLRELRSYAGMTTADKLGPSVGKHAAFVGGLSSAAVRWAVTPQSRRGPHPIAAFRMYVIATLFTAAVALVSFDLPRLNRLIRQLEPLAILRGVSFLHGSYLQTTSLRDFWLAEFDAASRASREILRDLSRDRLLPGETRKVAEGGAHFVLALSQLLDSASPSALAEIEALEGLGLKIWQVGAMQLRMAYHALRGEENRARAYGERADELMLQLGPAWQMEVWMPPMLSFAYSQSRDLIGMKRTLEQTERLQRAGFPFERTAEWLRSEYLRERGALDESMTANERALQAAPEQDLIWHAIMASRADTLLARGDLSRAKEVAVECLQVSSQPGRRRLNSIVRSIRTLALAEASEGRTEEALRRIARSLEQTLPAQNPVLTGTLHEVAARVALMAGDGALYRWHCEQMARWFRFTENPVLVARCERLSEAGEERRRSSSVPPDSSQSDLARDAVTLVDRSGEK